MDAATVASQPQTDESRRRFLVRAAMTMGAIGVAFSAVPFIESWLPSESARARGAPATLDLAKLAPGQMVVLVWRLKPIYVVRRTPGMLALLGNHDAQLKDPASRSSLQPPYADNEYRARTPQLFVTIGLCTHLGCLPKARFEPGEPPLGATWPGGFYCPCHGSRFDLAGRVFKGSPASTNLVIPPYTLDGPARLVIGVDKVTRRRSVTGDQASPDA